MKLFFRPHIKTDKIEECTYYNRNYSILAKNGYEWSMKHLESATLIPCQSYDYEKKESITSEASYYSSI